MTDQSPGTRRKRAGRGFSYIGGDGRRIRDPDELRRIKALVIPPAWTDVWICPNPHGHIQVTARDAKGRKQYRYHPRYREVRDETKFDRLLLFSEVLPLIREYVERDLSLPGLPRAKILATVVRLLEKTMIRAASGEYAREDRSFGLMMLRRPHVQVSGAKRRFEVRGKRGAMQSVAITDRRLARIVQRCQTLPGQELFKYIDDNGRRQTMDSGDVNDYLRRNAGRYITAKDVRTWAGTMLAATTLRDFGPAKTGREARQKVVQTIDHVAERLGTTCMVCRKYYVHPVVIEAYMRGLVLPAPPPPKEQKRERRGAALRREEQAVLPFLQTENVDVGRAEPVLKAPNAAGTLGALRS